MRKGFSREGLRKPLTGITTIPETDETSPS
jgi:hypothetical protein